MEGGAWGAAVRGVAKSRTRLNRLSSSSRVAIHSSLSRTVLVYACCPGVIINSAHFYFSWRLNNMLLNDQWITEDKKEIKKKGVGESGGIKLI